MSKSTRGNIVAAGVLLLATCAASDKVLEGAATGYIQGTEVHIKDVDWSKAETVEVDMFEYSFDPDKLTFQKNQPYRLHLENKGLFGHTFASEEFFKAIAVHKLTSTSGEIASPKVASIGVSPGESKDLYFVAIEPGSYPLECTKFMHSWFGMNGQITIQ